MRLERRKRTKDDWEENQQPADEQATFAPRNVALDLGLVFVHLAPFQICKPQ
jgi:hypothetical protein